MSGGRLIQVLVNTSSGYGRQVIRGIARFARSRADWRLALPPVGFGTPDLVTQARECDGVLARILDRSAARRLARIACPVINVSDALSGLPFPLVTHDAAAIADLAVAHGMERGFRRFAFCGFDAMGYSRARAQALAEACRRHGLRLDRYRDITAARRSLAGERRRLATWLRALPLPVLVVCCNDIRAAQVVDACRAASIPVPEAVAVLGVDNDEVVCTACPVELSSIEAGSEGIGWRAAARLAAILDGGLDPGTTWRVPPGGLVPRASTDVLQAEDPVLRGALAAMRSTPPPATIAQLLRHVPLSRRALELRCRQALGRSPLRELNAVRLARARELLRGTDLPIYAVAERAGYPNPNHFATAFRCAEGLSPLAWRRRMG